MKDLSFALVEEVAGDSVGSRDEAQEPGRLEYPSVVPVLLPVEERTVPAVPVPAAAVPWAVADVSPSVMVAVSMWVLARAAATAWVRARARAWVLAAMAASVRALAATCW